MRIVLVEDDHLQAARISDALERNFSNVRVERCSTESSFRDELERLGDDPPDLIVLDVMLRWADPAPDMPARPDDVRQNGYARAGLRCKTLLARDERTQDIPTVFYTVLDEIDLGEEARETQPAYLRKEAEPDQLIEIVRRLLRDRGCGV
jgi:CheY-like chemotaxis protein